MSIVSPSRAEIGTYYKSFWNEFHLKFRQACPGWKSVGDRTENYQHFNAQYPHSNYSAAFVIQRSGGIPLIYVELEAAPKLFKALMLQSLRINDEYGDSLIWERLAKKQRHCIICQSDFQASIHEQDRWPEFQDWIVSHLGKLRGVLQPRIDAFRSVS